MSVPTVHAPVALLQAPNLTPAAKVLWLALYVTAGPATPTRLAAASGLTLATIRTGLRQLGACGWHNRTTGAIDPNPGSVRVAIPTDLLAEPRIRPRAKLLYGLLQTTPGYQNQTGQFTNKALGLCVGVSGDAVREIVRELTDLGWLQFSQVNQLAPVQFTLRNPLLERRRAAVAAAAQRLKEADYRGQEIMREYLSLLIASDEFEDNARPGFLVNPATGERMELDRYYAPVAAFEYNGPQHYRTTERFPSERAVGMQQARDLMKEALCARRGCRLVVIQREDLSLAAMRQKVGDLLPLRDLRGDELLIAFLEKVSRRYRS